MIWRLCRPCCSIIGGTLLGDQKAHTATPPAVLSRFRRKEFKPKPGQSELRDHPRIPFNKHRRIEKVRCRPENKRRAFTALGCSAKENDDHISWGAKLNYAVGIACEIVTSPIQLGMVNGAHLSACLFRRNKRHRIFRRIDIQFINREQWKATERYWTYNRRALNSREGTNRMKKSRGRKWLEPTVQMPSHRLGRFAEIKDMEWRFELAKTVCFPRKAAAYVPFGLKTAKPLDALNQTDRHHAQATKITCTPKSRAHTSHLSC